VKKEKKSRVDVTKSKKPPFVYIFYISYEVRRAALLSQSGLLPISSFSPTDVPFHGWLGGETQGWRHKELMVMPVTESLKILPTDA